MSNIYSLCLRLHKISYLQTVSVSQKMHNCKYIVLSVYNNKKLQVFCVFLIICDSGDLKYNAFCEYDSTIIYNLCEYSQFCVGYLCVCVCVSACLDYVCVCVICICVLEGVMRNVFRI